jgi:hypothetical protein
MLLQPSRRKTMKTAIEATKPAAQPTTNEPEITKTAVDDRLHKLTAETVKNKELKFRGKQRQIVLDVLRNSPDAMTIAQVAKLAAKAGLNAVGGVEPSVKYHLHHLTKDGFVEVTNPTTILS